MSNLDRETAERLVALTEQRMQLELRESNAKWNEESAAAMRRAVQIELSGVQEEIAAILAGRPAPSVLGSGFSFAQDF